MFFSLLAWIVFGLFVGLLARLLTPGPDPIGIIGTTLLGVAGSVVGGFLGNLLFGGPGSEFRPAGFIGAIIGGVLVLLLYRRLRRSPQ